MKNLTTKVKYDVGDIVWAAAYSDFHKPAPAKCKISTISILYERKIAKICRQIMRFKF